MVWGPAGIGKTRLVGELAAEVQQEGAAVLYAGGGEVAEAALATVAEAGTGHRPTLLVLDYADDAPRACSRPPRRSPARPRVGRSWSASFITTSRARPPSPACWRAAPPNACASTRLTRMRRPRSPPSMPPRGRHPHADTARRERRGAASHPSGGRRLGPGGGGGAAEAATEETAVDQHGLRAGRRLRAASRAAVDRERRRRYLVEEPPDPSEPRSAPSAAWPRSMPLMPSTSSAASAWSPSWSPAWSARPCSPSSVPRAAASPRPCAPASCRRWRTASSRARRAGARR